MRRVRYSAIVTLKCDGFALKCDGVPYKEEMLKCDGLTRQSAMASPIRKKRLIAMVFLAKVRWSNTPECDSVPY